MTILVIEEPKIRCLSHCNKLPPNSNLVAVPNNTPLHKVPFFITEPSEYAKEVYRILYKQSPTAKDGTHPSEVETMNIVDVIAQTPLHLIDAVQHNDILYIVIKENIPCKTRDGIKAFKQVVKHSFVLCGPGVANACTALQIKGWKA